MTIFSYLINFIEAFLFTYFLAKYFDINKPFGYLVTFCFFQFCLLNYANFIDNNGLWLTTAVVLLMTISLFIWTKSIKFDYIYIVILYNSMLIIVSYIAASITNTLITLYSSLNPYFFYIACILAKMIQAAFTFYAIKKQHQFSTSLDLKNWSSVVLSDALILISLAIVVYALLTNAYSHTITLLLLLVLFFLALSSKTMIFKVDQLNKEKIDFVKTSELAKYNQQKMEMMNHIKNDIAAADHRMFYMLMQIEQYINTQEYTKLKHSVIRYRDLMSKNRLVTNTNNVVFDCLYSLKINDLVLHDINVENSIFISQKEIYNNISFLNFLTGIFDYFTNCSLLHVSMNEIGDLLSIKIVYRQGIIDDSELTKYFEKHLLKSGSYSLTNHKIKGVRISINMKEKYE